VYEQEVGAVEDSDLLDVALGGPDTSQRVRLMWRVRRLAVDAGDCASALAAAVADWLTEGFLFDPATMRLLSQAALQVSFAAPPSTSNPCDPTVQGGYLGADNQLIRLQIGAPLNGQPQLLWGYDNASFLYRISPVSGGQSWQLNQVPVDAYHIPQTGQVVEVLRTATILGIAPDATDPTGRRTIVRCIAEATGFVTTVASYNNTNNTVTLTPSPPSQIVNDKNPLFLRIWQGRQPIVLSSQPITLIDPTTQTSPGIQVTITVPAGGPSGAALPVGAFWMFAVRPSTPQAVYPERFLTGPQPPDGPRQWICPLAVILWEAVDRGSVPSSSGPRANVLDCRQQFCNLISVCNRPSGCCTVTIRPSDAGQLQTILDQAVAKSQAVTACLLPGTYDLPQTLRLDSRHSGLVLEACHGGATIQADPNAAPGTFGDGLIALVGADRVTLGGLRLIPTPTTFTPADALLQQFQVTSLQGIGFLVLIALRPFGCLGLTVRDCRVEFPSLALARGQVAFGVGIFASGDCSGLEVLGCDFVSQTPSTSTPIQSTVDSIDLAVLRRTAGPFIAVFGVLSVQGTVSVTSDFSILRTATFNAATFRDNHFGSLTIPILLNANLGKIQVQDNRVTGCLCGFWLGAYGFQYFLSSPALSMLIESESFLEIQFSLDLGPIYPLPTQPAATGLPGAVLLTASPAKAAAASIPSGTPAHKTEFALLNVNTTTTTAGIPPASEPVPTIDSMPLTLRLLDTSMLSTAAQATPPPVSVTLTGNLIEALPADADAVGSAAVLVVLVDTTDANLNPYNRSLVMASNHIHARPPWVSRPGIPVVGLVLGGPTTVTGNLILNEHQGDPPWSLFIFPPSKTATSATLLAVTGNVLRGESNLESLIRPDISTAPLNTWSPFNSLN
jgi:hypothetical protein